MATPMSVSVTFLLLAVCFSFLTVHSAYTTDAGNGNAPPVPSPAHSPAADYASPPLPAPASAPTPEEARSPSNEAPKSAPASSPPAPSPDLNNSHSPTPSPNSAPAPSPLADGISHSDVNESEESSSGGGMNGGKKAGIAVGVIAAACLVGFGGLVYKKRQDNIRRSQYGHAARRELL